MDYIKKFKRRFFGFLQNFLGYGFDAWCLFVAEMEINDLRERIKEAEDQIEIANLRIKLRLEKDAKVEIIKSMKGRQRHSLEVAQLV